MKTSELTGAALDYWVAMAEGKAAKIEDDECLYYAVEGDEFIGWPPFVPSTDWNQGGPIIERDGICVFSYTDCWGAICAPGREDWIDVHRGDEDARGPTPLIAAMRAYIASVYGEEVPDEPA